MRKLTWTMVTLSACSLLMQGQVMAGTEGSAGSTKTKTVAQASTDTTTAPATGTKTKGTKGGKGKAGKHAGGNPELPVSPA